MHPPTGRNRLPGFEYDEFKGTLFRFFQASLMGCWRVPWILIDVFLSGPSTVRGAIVRRGPRRSHGTSQGAMEPISAATLLLSDCHLMAFDAYGDLVSR